MQEKVPVRLAPAEKLDELRRADQYRRWMSLDDKRRCLQCGKIITGRQVEFFVGARNSDALQPQCPTENCHALPIDWALPRERENAVNVSAVRSETTALNAEVAADTHVHPAAVPERRPFRMIHPIRQFKSALAAVQRSLPISRDRCAR